MYNYSKNTLSKYLNLLHVDQCENVKFLGSVVLEGPQNFHGFLPPEIPPGSHGDYPKKDPLMALTVRRGE